MKFFDKEQNSLKEFLRVEDITNFLELIHQRKKSDKNEVSSIFKDFLAYESNLKKNKNKKLNEKISYLERITKAGKKPSEESKFFILSHCSRLAEKESFCEKGHKKGNQCPPWCSCQKGNKFHMDLSSFITKRNLFLIQILENFVIESSYDRNIVDIEKMKMFLPKTKNINNLYFKRLALTSITNFSKTTLKKKHHDSTAFQQKVLTQKAFGSALRLKNLFMGYENDPLKEEKVRKAHNFDLPYNEDDFYTILEQLLIKMKNEAMEEKIRIEQKIKMKAETPMNKDNEI